MHAFFYILSILFSILLPVILTILLRRWFRVSWLLFAIGSLTFIASQVVHLPLNHLLTKIGVIPAGLDSGWMIAQAAIVMGLTAGIC